MSPIFVVTVVSLLKRCSIALREVEISVITFERVESAVSLTVEIVPSAFETDSDTLELVEVKALVEALVDALIEALIDALIDALVDILIEVLVDSLIEALVDVLSDKRLETLFDSFNDIVSDFSSEVLVRAELFSLVSEELCKRD